MKFIDNIAKRFGYSKAVQKKYPGWALATADIEGFEFPIFVDNDNKLSYFEKVSWVNTGINMVSTIAGGAKWNVKRSEGEKTVDVPNHPFEQLLKAPNPTMSQSDLIFSTVAYLGVCNTAYWWKNYVGSKLKELWLIPTKQINPVPDGRMYIKEYKYDPGDGRQITLSVEEIVPFIGFNPYSMFTGLSNLESLRIIADSDLAMQSYNKRLFGKNNGKLPGVLAFADPISDADWDQMQKDVDKASALRNYLMLRNVKAGGVQWTQATATQRDMEFLNSRLANRDEIWGNIAPGLSSILSINATEANAKTGKATLIDFKVYPMLKKIGDVITNNIMPDYGENLLCEPEDIRVTDRVLLLKEIEIYSKTHTVDEVREKYYQDKPIEVQEVGRSIVNVAQQAPKQLPTQPAQIVDVTPKELPAEVSNEIPKVKDIRPAMLELEKWERKFKRSGKLNDFDVYNIPDEIVKSIKAGMSFEKARDELKMRAVVTYDEVKPESVKVYSGDAILKLAESIDKAFGIE